LQVYQKKGLPAELINEYRSAFTKVEDIAPDPNTILALN
jgi:SH3-like domain-containing protein